MNPILPTIRQGANGSHVTRLQTLLTNAGFMTLPDGNFGAKTAENVIAFQLSKGLTPDGVVGPKTWEALSVKATTPDASTSPQFTARTEKNLKGLNQKFLNVLLPFLSQVTELMAREGVVVEVLSGLRTWQQQTDLYAQGRTKPGKIVTNARPGSSWHNYGLAVDLGLFRDGVYLDEKRPGEAWKLYERIALIARNYGLECGIDWTTIKDTPHFEYHPRLTLAEAAKRLKAANYDVQQVI